MKGPGSEKGVASHWADSVRRDANSLGQAIRVEGVVRHDIDEASVDGSLNGLGIVKQTIGGRPERNWNKYLIKKN